MKSLDKEEFRKVFGVGSGLDGCDFTEHWNGWLYNAYCLIEPAPTKEEHMALVWKRAQEMAAWIISRKDKFQMLDRFQLIVGWPTTVRETARQIIKIIGDLDVLNLIVTATDPLDFEKKSGQSFFRRGWNIGIY